MQKNIAIFVNTFLRDDLIKRCIYYCKKYVPNGRLYITDNGRMTKEKEKMYKDLELEGHIIDIKKEFNYWWRKAFNEKLNLLQEEDYVLKIDDDFIINENSNLRRLRHYLETDNTLGMIGGQVWHDRNNDISHFIYNIIGKKEDKYVLDYAPHKKDGYIYCDMIPDFWLARREIFKDIKMEENYEVAQGGHEVFFEKIYEKRKAGKIKWRIGYTNEVVIIHEKSSMSEEYKKYRFGGFKKEIYHKNIKLIKPTRKPYKII